MKLKGLPAYVALLGGAVAIYAFVRSGGYNTAQRDLSRYTGGIVPGPAPTPPMTNPTTGQPVFGVQNPWANDPIFAPYTWAPSSPGYDAPVAGGPTFGVGLN